MMATIMEWIVGFGPLIAIVGVYLTILENRRAEKLRVRRQKIEELALLADKIFTMPTDVEDRYCKINLDVVSHMRIISSFYLDKKLSAEIEELQSAAIAVMEHQKDAEWAPDEERYWRDKEWVNEFESRRGRMIMLPPVFKQKCLGLGGKIAMPKLLDRVRRSCAK